MELENSRDRAADCATPVCSASGRLARPRSGHLDRIRLRGDEVFVAEVACDAGQE